MKWSYSAHSTLRRCERQFAFGHIVASHSSHDACRHEAFILKQLQHVSAWRGSLVHQVLSTHFLARIQARQPLDSAALTASAYELMEQQFAFSAARRYREPGMTKSAAGEAYCALYEHERGIEITPQDLDRVRTEIAGSLEYLASQSAFLGCLYTGHGHLTEIPLFFVLNGNTVAATIDLLFFNADGRPAVVDWKIAASETSDYQRQLLLYALAVARCGRWPRIQAEDVSLYEANLLKNVITTHTPTTNRLEEVEDWVYGSMVDVEALVGAGRFETLSLDDLDVAERPNTCAHCNFAPLCLQQLETAGRPEEAGIIQGRLW